MRLKSLNINMKAADDQPAGTFTGYASVFNNIDSVGDKVLPGAFAESLATFGENGSNIPCYWSHQVDNPMMCIGKTLTAVEDEHGLKVEVQLDLENEYGAQVYKMMKNGVVNQMSFAYGIDDEAFVEATENEAAHYELRKLSIYEVSVVQVGANQATELLDVKSRIDAASKSTTFDQSQTDKLNLAQRLISEVLDTSTADNQPVEGEEVATNQNAEEQETAKADEGLRVKSETELFDAISNNLFVAEMKGF